MAWKLTDNFKGRFHRIGHPGKTGPSHPCWKGGILIDRDGYIRVWRPEHPWPRKGYMMAHVEVVELNLGRKLLYSECIHHKNGNRQDNRLENLQVIMRGRHSSIHRALDCKNRKRDSSGRFA